MIDVNIRYLVDYYRKEKQLSQKVNLEKEDFSNQFIDVAFINNEKTNNNLGITIKQIKYLTDIMNNISKPSCAQSKTNR